MATKKGLLLQRITNKSPRSCVVPAAMITTDQEGYTTLTTTTVPFVNITATGNTIIGDAAADTLAINATVSTDVLHGTTKKVLFRDAATSISSVNAGYMDIAALTGIRLATGTFTLTGATNIVGAATVSTTLGVTGLATLTAGIDGKLILAGTETIAAGGTTTALALTKTCHYIDADAGGDTFTLANGVEGQIMVIVCKSATGVATITPATMKGGTSVTLNAAGDTVMLAFVGAGWSIVGGNGYTVVS